MNFSMFREDTKEEGIPGPVSMRRVLAFLLTLSAIGLFIGGYFFSSHGWYVFIPGIAALAGSLLMLFFTTWSDIPAIAGALKK